MTRTRNGKIRLEDRFFVWESEIKESYLKTKRPSTARTIKSKLLKVDEYEQKINKSVYNLNFEEIDDLMNSQFSIKSRNTASGNMSYIIGYIDFCIKRNLVKHKENRFKILSSSDKYKFVSPHAEQNKFLTREEILEAQNELANDCDKLILELIPLSVRGRTQKGNTNEELRNLRNDDIDFENKTITLRNNDGDERVIDNLSDHTLQLLRDTINQRFYKLKNGTLVKKNTKDESKTLPIIKTDFVFRTAGKSKIGKVKVQYFGSRINQMIKEYTSNSYISVTNLYFSGMIEYAKQLISNKNGEPLNDTDYSKIYDRFNYGEPTKMPDSTLYWGNIIAKIRKMIDDYFKAQEQKEKDKERDNENSTRTDVV